MYICVQYVCTCVCMYEFMYILHVYYVHKRISACMYASTVCSVCTYICVYTCTDVCMYMCVPHNAVHMVYNK